MQNIVRGSRSSPLNASIPKKHRFRLELGNGGSRMYEL